MWPFVAKLAPIHKYHIINGVHMFYKFIYFSQPLDIGGRIDRKYTIMFNLCFS